MKNIYLLLLLCFYLQISEAQTTLIENFQFEGKLRTYRLLLPAHYEIESIRPLVIEFHGYSVTAEFDQNFSNWSSVADTANFLVAYPNGLTDNSGFQYWNVGWSWQPPSNDVGFVSALIDTIYARHNINRNKVYAAGISNGGFMSYILAAELSNKITAVASVSGGMARNVFDTIKPKRPVPTIEIHGTTDDIVPYLGNTGNFESINTDTLTWFWAKSNGCNLTPHITSLPDVSLSDGTTASLVEYTSGSNNTVSRLYRIIGGSHIDWPGAGSGNNMDFNANVEMWKFFNHYQLSDFYTGLAETDKKSLFSFAVFPQPASNSVTLSLNKPSNHSLLKIAIVNNAGQNVRNYVVKAVSSCVELNISDLPKGFYVVKVNDGLHQYACKLLKD